MGKTRQTETMVPLRPAALRFLGVLLLAQQSIANHGIGVLYSTTMQNGAPTTSDSLSDKETPRDDTTGTSQIVFAFLLAGASAVFNGSFAALQKMDSVAKCDLDPVLFMLYNCAGVFLSSWLAIPFLPALSQLPEASIFHAGNDVWEFTPLGLAAGSLYVLAIFFSFSAVPRVGVSIGQGTWGGCAILVSFLWGVTALRNTVNSPGIAVVALLLLLGGIVGIALCESVASRLRVFLGDVSSGKRGEHVNLLSAASNPLSASAGAQEPRTKGVDAAPLAQSYDPVLPEHRRANSVGSYASGNSAACSPSEAVPPSDISEEASEARFVIGMGCSIAVGLFGGSILVPMSFVESQYSGLAFLPSFGIGAGSTSALFAVVYYVAWERKLPLFHVRNTFIPGLMSGLMWNAGNVCSIFSIKGIGYGTAYPILQCALFFGGLWGIFVFREVKDRGAIAVFFASALVLFGGAVVLSFNTKPPSN